MEREKRVLEQKYLWNLSHMEAYPGDKSLRIHQLELKKELKVLIGLIKLRQKEYDIGVREWEKRVIEGRIERKFGNRVIRESGRWKKKDQLQAE